MTETPTFLAERLRAEGEKTTAFFAALSPEQWQTMIYTEDSQWSVRSVLAHFVSAEQSFLRLFPRIQAGGPGLADDFDIDRYNASQQEKTQDLAPQHLLTLFGAARAEMADWVAGLTPADLEKTGRHPFLGQTSLGEMIKMLYRHNQIHQRDIRKTIPA